MTDDAERDAREVLYSLLSVERRINNSDDNNDASNNAQWHTPTVGEISNNNLSISEDNTSQSVIFLNYLFIFDCLRLTHFYY